MGSGELARSPFIPNSLFPIPFLPFSLSPSLPLFPVPCSLFPIPYSLFPVPYSLVKDTRKQILN